MSMDFNRICYTTRINLDYKIWTPTPITLPPLALHMRGNYVTDKLILHNLTFYCLHYVLSCMCGNHYIHGLLSYLL